ncbi:MAG: AAA family ATPase [Gammaproteobacteria bacterium]|nr:AAA family ATPase [Gammaproteobacteria bacterium]
MKRLNRILLVNWYLCEVEQIEIRGHCAIVGPNGSGKSSLLDAIQTVLTGGDKRFLALNAGAGERGTRTVREYCLGHVYDPGEGAGVSAVQPRREALSYLVLCFDDAQAQKEMAVGLCLSASQSSAEETIEGRFILSDAGLFKYDLLKDGEGGQVPKPWRELRLELERRFGEGFKTYPRPERFVEGLSRELAANPASPFNFKKFLKNFNNAICFKPIANPTEFVRRYVLEPKDVRVGQFRRSLENYRFLKERADALVGRIADLEAVDANAEELSRHQAALADYAWIAEELRCQALEAEREPLEDRAEEVAREAKRLDKLIAQQDAERGEAQEKLASLRAELAGSSGELGLRNAKLEKAEKEQARGAATRRLHELALLLRKALGLAPSTSSGQATVGAPEALAPLLAETGELLAGSEGLLSGDWPAEPARVDAHAAALEAAIAQALPGLNREFETAVAAQQAAEQELTRLDSRLKAAAGGKLVLRDNTRALIALLGRHGIAATPLCELAEVPEEHAPWRAAIESYLGGLREALIVAPEAAEAAIRAYRREGRALKGCRIINTTKSRDWLKKKGETGLAAFVRTEDEHARAYLNRTLAHVRPVESEAELLAQDCAVTADGMLHKDGSTTAMVDVEPMLGRASRAAGLAYQTERKAELMERLRELQQAKRLAASRAQLAAVLAEHLPHRPDAAELCAEREAYGSAIADSEARIAHLEGQRDAGMKSRLDQEAAILARLDAALPQSRKALDECKAEGFRLAAEIQRLAAEQTLAEARRREAAADPLYFGQRANEKLDALDAEIPDIPSRLLRAETARERERKRGEHLSLKFLDAVRQHQAKFSGIGDIDEILAEEGLNLPALRLAVQKTLLELRGNRLSQYQQQAEGALLEAEKTFRSDFVAQLQQGLEEIAARIDELNNHLKKRPFNGEFYYFRKKPNAELADVLDLVKSYSEADMKNVGSLFDEAYGEGARHAQALAKIHAAIATEADVRLLEDYRNYYSFEVMMKDAEGRDLASLSHRIEKGSGGENQAPFYVAIGAALASTYQIVKRGEELVGGMGLAVFDEAFNKLDVENTLNCAGFMKDLGLQIILAAPNEKYSLMTEMMDTIIYVTRERGAVYLDCEYLTPAARALMGSDSPYGRKAEALVE